MRSVNFLVYFVGLYFVLGLYPAFGDEEAQKNESNDSTSAPISGRIFSDVYAPTSDFFSKPFQQVSASAWLQVDPSLSDTTSAHLVLTVNAIDASSALSVTNTSLRAASVNIREGYVRYSKNGFDLKAGKMILPWGKSDGINPTDFLTAKDYTFFNPDDEVKRLGSTGFQVSWTPDKGASPFTVTWVLLPVFAQTNLLLAPNQIPTSITLDPNLGVPSYSISNSNSAVKISYSGNQWDASVLAFRGWNSLPDLQISQITGGTSPNVTVARTFHRYSAIGGDFSFTVGSWILRGESAYVWTENDSAQDPFVQPSFVNSVLGVERGIGDSFRFQTQFALKYFPKFQNPSQFFASSPFGLATPIYQQVAQTNAQVQNYQDAFRPASTFRFSYSDEGSDWSAEVFLMVNWVGGDYLLRPQVHYAWSESFKTTVGIDHFAGPTDRPLGVLAPFSAVFTEARFIF